MKSDRRRTTLYDTLEVSPRATPPVIKAAYRCLVQLNHPDKNPDKPEAAERLVRINHAYAVLSDPQKRQDYDLRLNLAAANAERRGSASTTNRAGIKPAPDAAPKRPVSRSFAFRPLK